MDEDHLASSFNSLFVTNTNISRREEGEPSPGTSNGHKHNIMQMLSPQREERQLQSQTSR